MTRRIWVRWNKYLIRIWQAKNHGIRILITAETRLRTRNINPLLSILNLFIHAQCTFKARSNRHKIFTIDRPKCALFKVIFKTSYPAFKFCSFKKFTCNMQKKPVLTPPRGGRGVPLQPKRNYFWRVIPKMSPSPPLPKTSASACALWWMVWNGLS